MRTFDWLMLGLAVTFAMMAVLAERRVGELHEQLTEARQALEDLAAETECWPWPSPN
jgi:hypothetical protein